MNDQQRQAVTAPNAYVQIIAGPGTGKTFTLVHRVVELLNRGVDPHRMFVLTFTVASARELLERITKEIGTKPPIVIGTFHHMGRYIINKFGGDKFKGFTTLNEHEHIALLNKLNFGKENTRHLLNAIGQGYIDDDVVQMYKVYETELKRMNRASLDQLFLVLQKFIANRPEVQEFAQAVLVDEFQDTSSTQLDIVLQMTAKCGNLTVVGDPDQSIYNFRHANPRNFAIMKNRVNCIIKYLETNYRSEQAILDFSAEVIKRSSYRFAGDRKLRSGIKNFEFSNCLNARRSNIQVVFAKRSRDEFLLVADKVVEILAKGVLPSEIAVLSRRTDSLEEFRKLLDQRSVCYGAPGAVPKKLRDAMAGLGFYLRAARDGDPIAVKNSINFPKRGLGPAFLASVSKNEDIDLTLVRLKSVKSKPALEYIQILDTIKRIMDKDLPFLDQVNACAAHLKHICSDLDLQTVARTASNLAQEENNWSKLLACLCFEDSEESQHVATEQLFQFVTVTTIHKSKGLEWPVVFVIDQGADENRIVMVTNTDLDETRRLMYVAMTRAKACLMVSGSGSYMDPKLQIKDKNVASKFKEINYEYLQKVTGRQIASKMPFEPVKTTKLDPEELPLEFVSANTLPKGFNNPNSGKVQKQKQLPKNQPKNQPQKSTIHSFFTKPK